MTTSAGAGRITCELIDLITESVATPPGAADRAETIVDLVSCMLDAVSWRLEPDGDQEEEQSLAVLISAARQHRARMCARSA